MEGVALLITQRETQPLPAFLSHKETGADGGAAGLPFPQGLGKRQQSPGEAGQMQARHEKELPDSDDC